jgi:hypothetical protein
MNWLKSIPTLNFGASLTQSQKMKNGNMSWVVSFIILLPPFILFSLFYPLLSSFLSFILFYPLLPSLTTADIDFKKEYIFPAAAFHKLITPRVILRKSTKRNKNIKQI